VNKGRAWNAIQMATQLKGHFFQSLTNGEQNVVRLAAIATNTNFHLYDIIFFIFLHFGGSIPHIKSCQCWCLMYRSTSPRRIVSSQYHIDGRQQMCGHIIVHTFNSVDMFAVSANPIIEDHGSSLTNVKCIDT
jgi:hypothetical protein